MPPSKSDITSVDFRKKGEDGSEYYLVRVTKRGENKRRFAGYIFRIRPFENRWVAAVRAPGGTVQVTEKGDLAVVKKLAERALSS